MLFSLARSAALWVRGVRNFSYNLIDTPVIILIYHRVTTLNPDPQLLAVSPDNFRSQLKYLKNHFPLLRFEGDWSNVSKPSVVVTFDDGYADNYFEALPILEEVGVPATFFVSSGNLNTGIEYWWDALERYIFSSRETLKRFYFDDTHFRQSWSTRSPADREKLYQDLLLIILKLDRDRRENLLCQLQKWADSEEVGREAYRAMTNKELQLLAKSKWVSIGAHTVTHSTLSVLSEEQQREEIFSSKKHLEKILGQEIYLFSYPFGEKRHYNRTSIQLCQEAGFKKAASNFSGQVHKWTDTMQLPRNLVRNWDVDTFASKIQSFWTR